ncbi:MAG: carbohydrate ABC transporter permease [bacterium]|nr:carbohydrate ABC transporter permease [bacterium]
MKKKHWYIHLVIIFFSTLTLTPFAFVINNSMRNNTEFYHKFFGLPEALGVLINAGAATFTNPAAIFETVDENDEPIVVEAREAVHYAWMRLTKSYRQSWTLIRPYMLNSILVCLVTATGVLLLGSISAYILSRYRFFGSKAIFFFIISTMMFPGVLTLVPAYLLVKSLHLLNSYWVLVLPYVAGGQVFAIFVFKSFFDGLPEDLFESARIDGAGHMQLYWNIVLPLSKPVMSVVLVMNVIGTWNNFLWPFITNTDAKYHVIASGLYVLATSVHAQNMSTLFAAYMIASIPLLIMFTYATKPFIQGVTSGAFKA